MSWEFVVIGRPVSKGSTKSYVHPKTGKIITTSTSTNLRDWEYRVMAAAIEAGVQIREAVSVRMLFMYERPKTHYLKASGALRANAPHMKVSRPDIDKLARAVLDGLQGIAYTDDSHVCAITAEKDYWYKPDTTYIRITRACAGRYWHSRVEGLAP